MSTPFIRSWIEHWQPNPKAQLRLFCFPYAGGGASIFRSWSDHLPSEIEVCPVQLPGRENRLLEVPFSRIDALIDALEQALQPYLNKPYAFFGHSMGGLIGFELARCLRRKGYTPGPVHLCVAGHRAPQIPDPDAPTHHLPDADFLAELRRLNGTPEEVLHNPEFLQLLLPLLRADFALCETYMYTSEPPLDCSISAFGGLGDQETPREALAAWRYQTNSTFMQRFFVGGHFFIHQQQKALLAALAQNLLTAQTHRLKS